MYPDTVPRFDLSKLPKLKEATFSQYQVVQGVQWITETLQTAKSTDLQRIRIDSTLDLVPPVEQSVGKEWQELDCLLIQLWTLHSIHPRIVFQNEINKAVAREVVQGLLPKLAESQGDIELNSLALPRMSTGLDCWSAGMWHVGQILG